MSLDDEQLLRYGRHIMLDEIGIAGQELICAARVVVIGAGGLGCPACVYLVAAGFAELVLVDSDQVELANLQRQFLYSDEDVRSKAAKPGAAARTLGRINPNTGVRAVVARADASNLAGLIEGAQVVLDGSDNFSTRIALNQACHNAGIPLVVGAAERFDGQVIVFDFKRALAPCYACLFPAPPKFGRGASPCALLGVFAPLAGLIGAIMASEAIKIAARSSATVLRSRMLAADLATMRVRTVALKADPSCLVCGKN